MENVSAPSNVRVKPRQIASWPHLAGYLLINVAVAAWGLHIQKSGLANAPAGQIAEHGQAMKNYVIDILADWALLFYCWGGVRWRGGNLATLSGGLWTSWKSLAQDVAVALPFWILWEATAYLVHWSLGPAGNARSIASLLPQTLPEILLWILVSVTAGFCEELQCRGYLQRQFHALSGSIVFAVLAQALFFGLMHTYQGWRQVVVISVPGVLYGVLAAWRRNLRANIVAHAWSDVWEGWLKQMLL